MPLETLPANRARMKNRWVFIILAVLLLGVIPLCSCGHQKQIAELEQTISELQRQLVEKDNIISELIAEKDARISQAQELYDFATEALEIHNEMNDSAYLYGDISAYIYLIPRTEADECTERREAIYKSLWKVFSYGDKFKLLYAPAEAVQCKDSLLDEIALLKRCYQALSHAITNKCDGNKVACSQHLTDAESYYDEILLMREQNEIDLINLQLQAVHDLKQ